MDDRKGGMFPERVRAPTPHHLQQLTLPAAEGLARVVLDVEQVAERCAGWQFRIEGNARRYAVRAESRLQPGGISQLADGDLDIPVGQFDDRPGRQLDGGLVAGRCQAITAPAVLTATTVAVARPVSLYLQSAADAAGMFWPRDPARPASSP